MQKLKQLFAKDGKAFQQNNLFEKHKANNHNATAPHQVTGIAIIESDASQNQAEPCEELQRIKKDIELYRNKKAHEIASIYQQTGLKISSILQNQKQLIEIDCLNICQGKVFQSVESYMLKSPKEIGSTLPNSEDKKVLIETPNFDANLKEVHEFSIDLREFTLGQKQNQSSSQSVKRSDEKYHSVSQFMTVPKQPSSKKIKDRIMNSGKNRAK